MPADTAILALTTHRPEMLPIIAEWMQRYDTIILEEPRDDRFIQMLSGSIGIDEYMLELDLEYPAFSQGMYVLLRELSTAGKRIIQVEPYLEILLGIHAFFAEGNGPADIAKQSIQYPVYLAERDATGALLDYYQCAATGSFDETLDALIRFARLDAKRFKLRDSLRSQALAPLLRQYPSAFVEAGMMHYPMGKELGRILNGGASVRTAFLTRDAVHAAGERGHVFGPGDRLTLLYRFHPNARVNRQMHILGARAIVYAKLIEKEEHTAHLGAFPHIRNELACIRICRQFSLEDCRRLFYLFRSVSSDDARQIVKAHLDDLQSKKQLGDRSRMMQWIK